LERVATTEAVRVQPRPRPEEPRTVAVLWRQALAAGHPEPAYLVEARDGDWREVTYSEAGERVDAYANGLLALGVGKGDAFAILASTSLEWALFDFALAFVGAVGTPIYANSSAKDCAYVLEHSDAVGVLVEDASQQAKVAEIRAGLPHLRHVFAFSDLGDLAARGRAHVQAHPAALEEATARVGENDLFTYQYTSGTTGPPKACMVTHRNYHAMVSALLELHRFLGRGDVMLLYLPLAHNFGRLMHLAGPAAGYTLAFCPDPLRVGDVLPHVRPTVFPSVPRVYEKVHTAVVAQFESASGGKRKLVDWALEIGGRASALRQRGERLPVALRLKQRLADRLVFSKVKSRLGGRLRFAISGGAPLAREVIELLHALDVLVLEGYGLSECTTACSVNLPDRFRFGTVGLPLPGFETRVDDENELLIRSDTVFAGYLKDERATAEAFTDDGWLRSGDVAGIDEDGFITITDRKKDLIVTAGGKNVAPQNIENDLKRSRFVSQALVVGDRRPYITALVTLERDEIAKWARARGLTTDVAALASDAQVEQLVQGVVDEANRDRSRFEQVKRFAILPRDFSAEEGEVTPTLKLKRRACEEHFAAELEALYR
jgi:long-chain acyl-CoA synthetase